MAYSDVDLLERRLTIGADPFDASYAPFGAPGVVAECDRCGYFVRTDADDACACGRVAVRLTAAGPALQEAASGGEPTLYRLVPSTRAV
jgi:hypothetical protein